MALCIPLPVSTQKLIKQERAECHPGLLLDKFAESWDPNTPPGKLSERVQKPTLQVVSEMAQREPEGLDLGALLERRRTMLEDDLRAKTWSRTTSDPLTLHLARASALENAGICLHPIYGFAYLPGTGLKGLARAYAETVWFASLPLSQQSDGWRTIERVFGWAPGSDEIEYKLVKPWKPVDSELKHHEDEQAAAGTVVFHDAWPTTWPRLSVDIVNNHHPGYYKGDGPPGDWESPVPVYFLMVRPGQQFFFALSPRRRDEGEPLVGQAQEWLNGALTHLGFGAKTAAGYGRFVPVDGTADRFEDKHPRFAEFPVELTLVTPAYLAGALQSSEDCDLRPATLRGLLRWWWRTMHAGYVDTETLRRMESLLWGDTKGGSLIQLSISPKKNRAPSLFEYRGYLSYGVARERVVRPSGSCWRLRMVVRRGRRLEGLTPEIVRDQAVAPLWLLCNYGGVGSKGRKGYGSLEMSSFPPDWSHDKVEKTAQEFRDWLSRTDPPFLDQDRSVGTVTEEPGSSSLKNVIGSLEWTLNGLDVRTVLETIEVSYQLAANSLEKHERVILGLPRKGQHVRVDRLASPVHIHVANVAEGSWVVRALAFPSDILAAMETSSSILTRFLELFGAELKNRESIRPRAPRTFPGQPRRD